MTDLEWLAYVMAIRFKANGSRRFHGFYVYRIIAYPNVHDSRYVPELALPG